MAATDNIEDSGKYLAWPLRSALSIRPVQAVSWLFFLDGRASGRAGERAGGKVGERAGDALHGIIMDSGHFSRGWRSNYNL